ncbi:UNVERIFIED_CONTAM: Myosin-11, partial [Sesamum radiatum]
MQATPVNIVEGSYVWVEDPEVTWIDGQVEEIKGDEAEVRISDEKKGKAIFAEDRTVAPLYLLGLEWDSTVACRLRSRM